MKPFPWKCSSCRERAVGPAVLPNYSAELEHDGRKYTITVTDLNVFQCQKCCSFFLDDEAGERLNDALRTAVGLLKPAEIRHHRERLGLTQKELAALLRISESTLSRWETGGQIQQRSLGAFMRVVFRFAEVQNDCIFKAKRWGKLPACRRLTIASWKLTPLSTPQHQVLKTHYLRSSRLDSSLLIGDLTEVGPTVIARSIESNALQ